MTEVRDQFATPSSPTYPTTPSNSDGSPSTPPTSTSTREPAPVDGWPNCTGCGHRHQGRALANVCVGCPCTRTGPPAHVHDADTVYDGHCATCPPVAIVRAGCQAILAYCPDAEAAERPADEIWCAEVRYQDSEPDLIQGWGADPLAAALELAGALYFELLTQKESRS